MTPPVVYDTNVIVSAILKPGSIPASLVALAMQGAVRLFLTDGILEEYKDVLKRPVFGFDPGAVNAFLNDLEKASVMVYPTKISIINSQQGTPPLSIPSYTRSDYSSLIISINQQVIALTSIKNEWIKNDSDYHSEEVFRDEIVGSAW